MSLRGLFARARQRDHEAVARVKTFVVDTLALPEDAAVTVSEIVCADPGCPDLETVALVMRRGAATVAYRVRKPLGEITQQDVRDALASSGAGLQ